MLVPFSFLTFFPFYFTWNSLRKVLGWSDSCIKYIFKKWQNTLKEADMVFNVLIMPTKSTQVLHWNFLGGKLVFQLVWLQIGRFCFLPGFSCCVFDPDYLKNIPSHNDSPSGLLAGANLLNGKERRQWNTSLYSFIAFIPSLILPLWQHLWVVCFRLRFERSGESIDQLWMNIY